MSSPDDEAAAAAPTVGDYFREAARLCAESSDLEYCERIVRMMASRYAATIFLGAHVTEHNRCCEYVGQLIAPKREGPVN